MTPDVPSATEPSPHAPKPGGLLLRSRIGARTKPAAEAGVRSRLGMFADGGLPAALGELELFLRLVRQSFVPPPEIRRLRDLTRLRKAQINERTRAIQRLEKVLRDQAHQRRFAGVLESARATRSTPRS